MTVVGLAAAIAFAFRAVSGGDQGASETPAVPPAPLPAAPAEPVVPPPNKPPPPAGPTVPLEIRGVHVSMQVLSLPGRLDKYLALVSEGLNTLEVDVKDERGEVAFASPIAPLATKIGSARGYYDPEAVAERIKAAGVYLIGRVVVFEDPWLTSEKPGLAIKNRGGGVWRDGAGYGWSNPYDERVWKYNVDIAEAAARAGFDEIMFDYVRFPSDGNLKAMKFLRKQPETKSQTIARFLQFARNRLEPLDVRVSAAVFGLAATRDLGIGQDPRKLAPYLDAISPMVYPSHFGPGELDIRNPAAAPGDIVSRALGDFNRVLRGQDTDIVPWLQDFTQNHRPYTLDDVRAQIGAAQRRGAEGYLLWNSGALYTPGALETGSR